MDHMLGNLLKSSLEEHGNYQEYGDILIEDICVDSRHVKHGAMFVAIPGTSVKGTDFLQQAVERGALAVVVPQEELADIKTLMPRGFPVIPVADPRYFAGTAASIFYGEPSSRLSLIGITGTNGKTTVSWLLESILVSAGLRPGVIGTINQHFAGRQAASFLTTPDAVTLQKYLSEMVETGIDSCLLEVSSHALDQKRVAGCRFSIGVFTNLSRDHLDYHHEMEDYFHAKRRLFTEYHPGYAVLNTDDTWGRRLLNDLNKCPDTMTVTYGLKDAMVVPDNYTLSISGITAILRTPSGDVAVSSPLIGLHNLYNILAASAAACALGISTDAIAAGIAALRTVPGRLERVDVPLSALVDYAHTPDALEKVLRNLRELTEGRLVTVAGCGGDRDRGKRPLMAAAAAAFSDTLFLTSDNPRTEDPCGILRDMVEGIDSVSARCHVRVVPQRDDAIRAAVSCLEAGDCLLVAGKGHETCQIIGTEKIPFDDREVIRDAFSALHGRGIAEEAGAEGTRPPFSDITAGEVALAVDAVFVAGSTSSLFSKISTDTRTIGGAELFWALEGENYNGNMFAADALAGGAAGVVVERNALEFFNPEDFPGCCVIVVEDTLDALGRFASWYRRRHGFRVAGITGSCGKTSTRALVASVARTMFPVHETRGNFNNLIGLPLSMLASPTGTMWGIFEMGMNQPGEMERLCRIAGPDMGIITNIRAAHLEGLGSIEAIAEEKWELWKAIPEYGSAVINLDDPLVVQGARFIRCRSVVGYSMRSCAFCEMPASSHALVRCESWAPHGAGSKFTCIIMMQEGKMDKISINIPLPGEVNVQNALAAVAAGVAMHIPLNQIREGLENVSPVHGRLEYHELANKWLLIGDFYNANPASMQAALDTLRQYCSSRPGVAVLGDMLELGSQAPVLHRELGAAAAGAGIDMLLVAGEHVGSVAAGAIAAGMPEAGIRSFPGTEELCAWLRDRAVTVIPDRAALLVKGSRGMRLERAAQIIEETAGGTLCSSTSRG